jgi:hypothetical protein
MMAQRRRVESIVAGTLSGIVAPILVERNTIKKSHENKFQLFLAQLHRARLGRRP